MNIYEVIRRSLTTEKTYGMREQGKHVFEAPGRHQDRGHEQLSACSVRQAVNVINVPEKRRRAGRRWIVSQPAKRKAVVRLAQGQSIRALESA